MVRFFLNIRTLLLNPRSLPGSVAFVLMILILRWPVSTDELTFAMMSGGSTFFEPIEEGFMNTCALLGVNCIVNHTRDCFASGECKLAEYCEQVIQSYIDSKVDGIAIASCAKKDGEHPVVRAISEGIPVIAFDKDIPGSGRIGYVGTDNDYLGRTLAKLLQQLRPEGGTFVLVGATEARADGFRNEMSQYNEFTNFGMWRELPLLNNTDGLEYIEQMELYLPFGPTAFVVMRQTPMRSERWPSFVAENRFRNITFIGTDGSDYQIKYLNNRFVDGLVGQLPYETGSESAKALFRYLKEGSIPEFTMTNLVSYNLIPIELPPIDKEMHLLGNLVYLGYLGFGINVCLVIGFSVWMIWNWEHVVVRSAQAIFLSMSLLGALILGSAIIPLSFDDDGIPDSMGTSYRIGICMSIPWLCCTGYTLIFTALFSKTWRLYRLLRSDTDWTFIEVSRWDMFIPFVMLSLYNVTVLVLWTSLDPLEYVREDNVGTDVWNRVLSSQGICRAVSSSGGSAGQQHPSTVWVVLLVTGNFLSALGAVLLRNGVFDVASASTDRSLFSEATYNEIANQSIFQTFLTGIPIMLIVKDSPEAFYLVSIFTVFFLCVATISLIFVPKMWKLVEFSNMSEDDQNEILLLVERKVMKEQNTSSIEGS